MYVDTDQIKKKQYFNLSSGYFYTYRYTAYANSASGQAVVHATITCLEAIVEIKSLVTPRVKVCFDVCIKKPRKDEKISKTQSVIGEWAAQGNPAGCPNFCRCH